jgi:O-antigen/teichoic acid export membrane protein
LVYFFAGRLLPSDEFGFFYVASTIGNILLSGANVLNAYFTRHLARVGETDGTGAIAAAAFQIERKIILIGVVASTLLFGVLLIAAQQIGVQSPILILLIVLDAYTSYVTDFGRVLLQSLRKTLALGLYTTAWMSLRFGLCIAGIVWFKTVWGALSGIVLSAVVVFVFFHLVMFRRPHSHPAATPALPLLALVPSTIGYGLMVLVSNLDVLFGYITLQHTDLGIYAASSVFPKGALVVITPLLQMLIPTMISPDRSKRSFIKLAARAGGVIGALCAIGSFLLWLLSDQLCGSRFGLKLCSPSLLDIVLLSVLPLSLLRTLAILEFARGRELVLLWLVVPLVGYSLFILKTAPGMNDLAIGFSAFSVVSFLFFAAICFAAPGATGRVFARISAR